ncbi:MAG: LemA family protein [Edaphobacter sp.]
MKPLWIGLSLVGVIVLVLLFGFGSYVSTKNTLVQKNEAINQAYSQVNVVQQRRLDLIPNLVASVKGYVSEESTVLTNIANARAAITSAPDRASSIAANSKLDVALGPFFRLQEEYPNLKGSEQFTRLTDELAGTENRIAVERGRYNKTLEDYNVYVRQFPNSIWANIAGFHYRDEYFRGNPENSAAPKVDFSK